MDGSTFRNPTRSDILRLLSKEGADASFVERLKIRYRPWTCPFEDVLALVDPGHAVFDVGCGSGMLLQMVAEYRDPTRVAGIEITKSLVENARTLLSRYDVPSDFQVYDGVAIPAAIAEYDTVLLVDVLHHVPPDGQDRFLSAIVGAMRPGARLVFKDIAADSVLVVFNKLHDRVFAGEFGNERRPDDVAGLLSSAGLQIDHRDRRTVAVYPHYSIVGTKA